MSPQDSSPSLSFAPTTVGIAGTALWYVVHTKPRLEQAAQEQLQRQGFEVYLPLFRVFRKRPRAEKPLLRHEAMFPRYLFLRPTRPTQSLSVVRSTLGVTRLVTFGTQPATLVDAAVQAIRRAEAARETAPLDAISPYKPGMPVRLLDPALAGLQALVQSVSRDRVTLLLDILGRPQSVQVEFGRIAPL